jgi:hypothetical protein
MAARGRFFRLEIEAARPCCSERREGLNACRADVQAKIDGWIAEQDEQLSKPEAMRHS